MVASGDFEGSQTTRFFAHHDPAHNTYFLSSNVRATIGALCETPNVRNALLTTPGSGLPYALFVCLPGPDDYPGLHPMDRENFVQHVSTHRSDPLRSISEWTDAINSLSRQWISDRQSLLEQLSKTETEAGKRWSLEKLDEVKRAFSKFICHCYEAMQNRRIQYMTEVAALEDNDPMRDLTSFRAAKKGKKSAIGFRIISCTLPPERSCSNSWGRTPKPLRTYGHGKVTTCLQGPLGLRRRPARGKRPQGAIAHSHTRYRAFAIPKRDSRRLLVITRYLLQPSETSAFLGQTHAILACSAHRSEK